MMAVVVVAGAGSQAIAWLLGVAGASRTLLEVLVPYGRLSMMDFLGREPEQFVSSETAREMARAAYRRALRLRESSSEVTSSYGVTQGGVVGLGCTATIATDRPKRGEHRCCIATWDDLGVVSYNLLLAKGQRHRVGEEEVVSRLIIHALARSCGIAAVRAQSLAPLLGLMDTEHLDIRPVDLHPGPIQWLLSGEVSTVTVHPDGGMVVDDPLLANPSHSPLVKVGKGGFTYAVLAGSFSPLHYGHEQLARVAAEILGTEVVFELSVVNVDKPPLAEAEVRRRLRQFQEKWQVVLTRAPTFRKKADLFPGCTFVIGWDTAVRLVEPRYYGGDETAMLTALAEIWAAGCRFLVAGRHQDGHFHTLSEVPIPQGFRPLFQEIPESRFRADISSTVLRSAK
jgi:hypothetical protein